MVINNTSKLVKKILVVIIADILLSFGISLCIKGAIGTDIYTTLQDGISKKVGLEIGTVNLIMNIAIALFFVFYNRKLIGIGSIIFCILTGPLINLFNFLMGTVYPSSFPFIVSMIMVLVGVIISSAALATYVQLNVGVQPLDMLIITIKNKTGLTYGKSMYIFNAIVLLLAILLKGKIGVGTVINYVCCGKIIDLFTPKIQLILKKNF